MTKIVTTCEQPVAAPTDSGPDMATDQPGTLATILEQNMRIRAERLVSTGDGTNPKSLSPDEIKRLLHELQVHQFELEIQNEELCRTQAQLEASQSRYFDLYDQAPIGYLTVSKDGNILEANRTASKMLGTTRSSLVSQLIYRFIHQDDQDIYFLHSKGFLETFTPQVWEMRMLKADGSMFWCRLQAIQSQSGEILITLSDYSENKLAIEELQASEERHRLLANTMLHGVVHQDANGKIIMMNPAAERILGKSREQFLGSNSVQEEHHTIRENGVVFPGNEHPSMVALLTGHPVRGEIMGVFNPTIGEYRWISIDAVPVFRAGDTRPSEVYTVFEDITERKQKDQAIRLGKEEWERTFDSVPDLIAIIDSKHRITRINKTMSHRLGLTPQECIGQPCFTAIHGTGIPPEFCIHAMTMSDGAKHETEVLDTQLGSDFLITTTPLFTNQGEVYATVHVARDITIQKRVERALRENEAQLKLFIEHAPAALAMFDRDMRYLRLSSRWRSDYGLGDRDVLGLSHYEVFPEISEHWKEAHRRGMAGEVLRADAERFERADGALQWVRWEIRPWFDLTGNVGGIVIFAEDITDLKQAEDARHATEEMNRKILQALPAHIAVIDRQGCIIAVNQAWTDFAHNNQGNGTPKVGLGENYCEVCRRAIADHEADGEKALDGILDVLNGTLNLFSMEYPCHSPHQKQWFFMTVVPFGSGAEGGAVITHLNITALKEAQEALQASEKQLRFYLDNSPMAVIEWDKDFTVTRWTGESERMFGWSAAEVLGKTITDLKMVFEEDMPIVERTATRLSDGISRQVVSTNRNYTKSGDVRHCTWYNSVLTDQQGQMRSVLSEVIDITELKRAEAELRSAHDDLELKIAERTRQLKQTYSALIVETQEKLHATEALRKQEHILIQQNRHAAMGEMIGNIAHQWRQPLNTLGLFTQRLGFFYGSPSFDKEFLDTSVAKSMEIIHYMSRTIDDFRNFFSTEREKSDFKVNAAVSKVLSLVEASFKDCRIDIIREDRAEVTIHGFANEYAQVLLNIFVNAKDALIEKHIAIPRLNIIIDIENGVSVVTVADNAGGVPEDIIGKIFDPYFTTKGPQQGTGVGLFMSKTIIENKMGGRLTVRNTAEGAEFRIEV